MANDCIFCKIVRGEAPAHSIYEDEKTLAFLDIFPVSEGHALVIPKSLDVRNIFDISSEDFQAMAETARKVACAIEKAVDADGINIRMNNRIHAGQEVDHPHIHVIPRFKGDGLAHWPSGKYSEGEADAIAEKIKSALS